MCACIRASLVLVSLFLFLHVSEAGLLRERLLSRPILRDVYNEKSSDVHKPSDRRYYLLQIHYF